ncbi:hypothetical protein AKJ09_08153 [Labilithrix luteola]|uniref:Uncharacterized protein n=1 Tax=Labilithrix luteola TaxID=1391654 RepID=A0A0K1Q7V3_9BACT|nr:hypothetical protein AKJ09_08153 [Labilithrix luteola]
MLDHARSGEISLVHEETSFTRTSSGARFSSAILRFLAEEPLFSVFP